MKLFLTKLLSGAGRIVPVGVLIKLVRCFPKLAHLLDAKGDFIVTESNGLRYWVNCRSNIDRMLVRGDYAAEFEPLLAAYLKENCSAIDCGSNIGAAGLRMAANMKGDARLVLVEPGPPLAARLRKNLDLNPQIQGRTVIINAGVGEMEGELFWNEDQANAGNANLLEKSGIRVPVTTVDTIVAQNGITSVGFIKIDVEGMELSVIKGANAIIERDRPVIYYEASLGYEKKTGNQYVLEIERFLKAKGYKIGYWDGGFREIHYPDIRHDLLAVPAEKLT